MKLPPPKFKIGQYVWICCGFTLDGCPQYRITHNKRALITTIHREPGDEMYWYTLIPSDFLTARLRRVEEGMWV